MTTTESRPALLSSSRGRIVLVSALFRVKQHEEVQQHFKQFLDLLLSPHVCLSGISHGKPIVWSWQGGFVAPGSGYSRLWRLVMTRRLGSLTRWAQDSFVIS